MTRKEIFSDDSEYFVDSDQNQIRIDSNNNRFQNLLNTNCDQTKTSSDFL